MPSISCVRVRNPNKGKERTPHPIRIRAARGGDPLSVGCSLCGALAKASSPGPEVPADVPTTPESPAQAHSMLVGACPRWPGSGDLADALRVGQVWGETAAVRQFLATQVAPRPPKASRVITSWNSRLSMAGFGPAQAEALAVNLQSLDRVTRIHEPWHKIADGELTWERFYADFNTFSDAFAIARPDLVVELIVTGGEAMGWSGADLSRLYKGKVRCGAIGVDLDGVPFYTTKYGDWQPAITRTRREADDWAGGIADAPEVGAALAATRDGVLLDPDGVFRAPFLGQTLGQLDSARYEVTCAYEYENSDDPRKYTDAFTDPASAAIWARAVA